MSRFESSSRMSASLSRRRVVAASAAAAALGASGRVLTFAQTPSSSPAAIQLKPWEPRFTDNATIRRFGFGTDNVTSEIRSKAFEEAYPNIKLEVTPEITDQKILTAVASGDVPDLIWVGTSTLQAWAARDALEPLDDLISGDDRFNMDELYPSVVTRAQYNGKTYGVPQFVDCRPLWINHAPLQEVGLKPEDVDTTNWDKLKENATKLLKKDGDAISRLGFDPKAPDFFWMWSWANGGNLLSDDGTQATFDDEKNTEALQYVLDVYNAQGGYGATQAFIQTTGFDGADNFFVKNQVAATLFENWLLGIVAQGDPNHEFSVVPFKGKDGKIYSITGGNAWAIPKGAKNKQAAWEWISFFSNASVWLETSKKIKERLDGDKKHYTPSLTANSVVNEQLVSQVFKPSGNASFDNTVALLPQLLAANKQAVASPVLKEIDDIIANTVVKPALSGDKSPQDALKEGQEKAQKAIDSFKK